MIHILREKKSYGNFPATSVWVLKKSICFAKGAYFASKNLQCCPSIKTAGDLGLALDSLIYLTSLVWDSLKLFVALLATLVQLVYRM